MPQKYLNTSQNGPRDGLGVNTPDKAIQTASGLQHLDNGCCAVDVALPVSHNVSQDLEMGILKGISHVVVFEGGVRVGADLETTWTSKGAKSKTRPGCATSADYHQ